MELPESLLNLLGGADASTEAAKATSATTEAAAQQPRSATPKLRLHVQKEKRSGKTATVVLPTNSAELSDADLDYIEQLSRLLRRQLSVGGSYRDGEILLQGDVRERVTTLLQQQGHIVR